MLKNMVHWMNLGMLVAFPALITAPDVVRLSNTAIYAIVAINVVLIASSLKK